MSTEDPAAARRAARRAAARAHHPDLGGDADSFVAAMAEVDAVDGSARGWARRSGPVFDVRPSSRLRVVSRTVRRTVRDVRSRLPRAVPGSTRYFRL